jgi:hypothetical protein
LEKRGEIGQNVSIQELIMTRQEKEEEEEEEEE